MRYPIGKRLGAAFVGDGDCVEVLFRLCSLAGAWGLSLSNLRGLDADRLVGGGR